MNLLQNKTVKKLSKQELSQDYVFDKEFAKSILHSYLEAKNSQSLQEFLCDYLSEECLEECEWLYQQKLCSLPSNDTFEDVSQALWNEIFSEKNLESDTRKQEINNRSNVSYDLDGFEKIDGVLYYITQEIAYDLTDVPFECVVTSSVYYSLQNNTTTNVAWKYACDFLLDPLFHKELLELLTKGDLIQKDRERMLSGFLQVLPNKQNLNRIGNSPEMYNFDIIYAILQLIAINESTAHELAKNCADTMSLQGIIDYLSVLVKLEKR